MSLLFLVYKEEASNDETLRRSARFMLMRLYYEFAAKNLEKNDAMF